MMARCSISPSSDVQLFHNFNGIQQLSQTHQFKVLSIQRPVQIVYFLSLSFSYFLDFIEIIANTLVRDFSRSIPRKKIKRFHVTANLSISNDMIFNNFRCPGRKTRYFFSPAVWALILGVKFGNPIPRKGNEKFRVLCRFELYNWVLNL